jgi:hypothetical protein
MSGRSGSLRIRLLVYEDGGYWNVPQIEAFVAASSAALVKPAASALPDTADKKNRGKRVRGVAGASHRGTTGRATAPRRASRPEKPGRARRPARQRIEQGRSPRLTELRRSGANRGLQGAARSRVPSWPPIAAAHAVSSKLDRDAYFQRSRLSFTRKRLLSASRADEGYRFAADVWTA